MTDSIFEAIIFDYDLTLVDSFTPIVKLYKSVCEKYGGDSSMLDFKTMFGMLDDEAIPYACECAKPNISSEEFRKIIHKLEPEFSLESPLIIDKNLFRKLKNSGLDLFIVTNNLSNNVNPNLIKKGIHKYFKEIKCADNFGNLKCKGEVIKDIVSRFGYNKKNALYVGDHINDVEYAKKAKVPVLAITTGFHKEKELKNAGADYVMSSFNEFIKKILIIPTQ